MAIRTNFWRFSRFFGLLHLLKTFKGEDDQEFFVLVSALRSLNVFPYALLLDVDLIDKRFSFDQARALFSLTQSYSSSCSGSSKETEERPAHPHYGRHFAPHSVQFFTIFKVPAGNQRAAYHFPPTLSQKNAYSAYSN